MKLKTRKSAAKRYKVTGSGKVLVRRAGKQHLNEKQSSKTKRNLGCGGGASGGGLWARRQRQPGPAGVHTVSACRHGAAASDPTPLPAPPRPAPCSPPCSKMVPASETHKNLIRCVCVCVHLCVCVHVWVQGAPGRARRRPQTTAPARPPARAGCHGAHACFPLSIRPPATCRGCMPYAKIK